MSNLTAKFSGLQLPQEAAVGDVYLIQGHARIIGIGAMLVDIRTLNGPQEWAEGERSYELLIYEATVEKQ